LFTTIYYKATDYRLDGPGLNTGGGEIFCTCPDRPWGPSSLLYKWYRVFPRGKEWPGRDADPSPPSSAVVKERVELYLYSPYGPYGLYRASVPVQGCTLPHLTLPDIAEMWSCRLGFTYDLSMVVLLAVCLEQCIRQGEKKNHLNPLGLYL